jgi:protein gp37
MKRSRMFHLDRPRPVKTWNPVHGCRYGCYRGNCWAARMAKHLQAMGLESYQRGFEPAFVEKELSKRFGPDDVVFVVSMGDLFGDWVLSEWIRKVIDAAKLSPATFFFETKNSARYAEFLDIFPKNAILSTTIETNRDYGLSSAPPVGSRYEAFKNLSWPRKHVSVEPIMDFDPEVLAGWLFNIGPEIVSVGFDNYHNRLPEPSLEKVMLLIQMQRVNTIFEKNQK